MAAVTTGTGGSLFGRREGRPHTPKKCVTVATAYLTNIFFPYSHPKTFFFQNKKKCHESLLFIFFLWMSLLSKDFFLLLLLLLPMVCVEDEEVPGGRRLLLLDCHVRAISTRPLWT